ncbi:three component ABC system middle component [Shewanella baltica]|uniref:three component ABC system middle component n=2 Tax=Shewanella baltica TaxID=62322 RepID=UPI002878096C|nr:three component ABC system middle component [Shewanella baltica]
MNYQINLANCIFAIHAVLTISKSMPICKGVLIYPFVYQKKMLSTLANKNKSNNALEKIIIDNPEWFSNFDNIYYSTLPLSINAIQYMKEMEYIDIKDGIIILIKEFNYNENMGQEAMKYQLSSNCISKLLSKPADYLYLNLRITL